MKIFDISQEVLNCEVYPGDPAPQSQLLADMSKGDLYNLTVFSMCAHNGTHIDAPFHFFQEGKAVDEMLLETFVGPAYVVEHHGIVTEGAYLLNAAPLNLSGADGAPCRAILLELPCW